MHGDALILLYESKFYCFGGIETSKLHFANLAEKANLNSTASAVLRRECRLACATYTGHENLNSTASAVLRWESRKSQNQCILALSIIMVPYKRF